MSLCVILEYVKVKSNDMFLATNKRRWPNSIWGLTKITSWNSWWNNKETIRTKWDTKLLLDGIIDDTCPIWSINLLVTNEIKQRYIEALTHIAPKIVFTKILGNFYLRLQIL